MDSASLDKLRKIAGLLGSEHAGERAAAALKATAMLKAAGVTWGQLDLGKSAPPYALDQGHMANYWESMYRGERERSTRLAADIQKLKREVDRLKGMWPNGEVPKPRPVRSTISPDVAEEMNSAVYDNKSLRRKVAAAVEACAAGTLHVSGEQLQMFRFLMMKSRWSMDEKAAIKRALIAIYSVAGG